MSAPLAARFSSANAAPSLSHSSSSRSIGLGGGSGVEDVSTRQERISERAEVHFEKHRSAWTAKQYGVLLAKDSPTPSLRPYGMPDDRKERLMRAADFMVRNRFQNRLNNITQAADRMRNGTTKAKETAIGR